MHGGKSLGGMDSPTYRGKGRSKYLPTALADQYLASLNDPELLAIDKDIALVDLRMNELASKLDASDMGKLWVEADAAWRLFERAQHVGDVEEMRIQLGLLGPLIKRAANNRYLWADLISTAKDLAQLRLSEHKRLVDMKTMVGEAQMWEFMGLLKRAVYEVVTSRLDIKLARAILDAIDVGFQKFLPTNRGQ